MPTIKNPDLAKNLGGFDLGHFQIVAELWGVELTLSDPRLAPAELATILLDSQLIGEVYSDLPETARVALQDLQANEGCLPWALFVRRYGEVREMGPGRRDRERPHRRPASPAEALWYRALVGRAFFDTDTGPQEFAFIPADLIPLLPLGQGPEQVPLGRAAASSERAHIYPATDQILDDACTLLAALRLGLPLEDIPLITIPPPSNTHPSSIIHHPSGPPPFPLTPIPLRTMLDSTGLLDPQGVPQPEPTRAFLEASRGEALSRLVKVWLESQTFNELGMLPGLVLEGEWANDPLQARRKILGFLAAVPKDTWWSLEAFIAAIRQRFPDFQRPAGDYDSWFIRREGSEAEPLGTSGDVEIQSEAWNPGEGVPRGEYLRGFEHWDEVDGALVRFIIAGPLHWLGVLDLAAPAEDKPVSAFRASRWAEALLQGEIPRGLLEEDENLQADSQGRLRVSTRVPRAVRYQVARFCAWEGWDGRTYRYRLTPGALERASGQGLRIDHLLGLLRRHTTALPPSLVTALERWEAEGTPARIESLVVLRVASPEILQRLRASRAARFLGDPLGPTAVIVKPGAQEKVLATLAEMGYLGELIREE